MEGSCEFQKWMDFPENAMKMLDNMATSAEPTLKLRDIDEELKCPICLGRFTSTRTLPCSHSFCHDCLDYHIKHRTTTRGEFPCPSCREVTKAPPNGANGFQRNILANNLVDILTTQETAEKCCDVCTNGTRAIYMCLDCPEKLCELHQNDHKKLKLTKNHLLVPLNDVQQGKYENEIRARQAVHCINHPEENVRYFCTECKIQICIDCINTGECPHTPSQRQNLTVASEKIKVEMKIYVAQLQAQIKEKHCVKKAAKNSHKQTIASITITKKEIEEWYEQLFEALATSKHNHIATLEQNIKDKCCAFTTLTCSIEDDLKRLKQAEKQALMVYNYGNPSEIILSHRTILTQLQKLEKEIPNREPPCSFTVSFVPNQFIYPYIFAHPKQAFGEIYETVLMKEFDSKLPEDEEDPTIYGIVIHSNNDISALDYTNNKLKTFSSDGTFKKIFTENKSYSFKCLTNSKLLPSGEMLVSDSENVILVNSNNEKITKIYPVGKSVTAVTMNHAGQLVFTTNEDVPSLTVWSTKKSRVVLEVNKNEKGENLFYEPYYVTVNSKGHMIVTDCGKESLFIFDLTGALLCDYNPTADQTVLYYPSGVCTDEKDNIYVADSNNRIIQLTPEGQFARVVVKEKDGLDWPLALTFDNQGNLVTSEETSGKIKVFQFKSM